MLPPCEPGSRIGIIPGQSVTPSALPFLPILPLSYAGICGFNNGVEVSNPQPVTDPSTMPHFNEQEFKQLVDQAEAEAARNIDTYKTKLALFAVLGYLVLFGALTALILLVGATLTTAAFSSGLFLLLLKKKILIVALISIWVLARALWIKLEPVKGYRLQRDQFPQLFQQIDELSQQLDALPIHEVMLDDQLNAMVLQRPQFGLFGKNKNTLVLGIQLLLALSPAEMRSVLAHELGHLSNNHGRFNSRIYRIRATWQQVMDAFDHGNSFGSGLMKKFFDWYAPRFAAYSFVLARNNEYEADQAAAELTSPAIASKALVNVHASAPHIEREYWQRFYNKADALPKPPFPAFSGLAHHLKTTAIDREQMLELIKQVMQEETHFADTHPSLKDRLACITDKPQMPAGMTTNAAEAWLGDRYKDIINHFDQQWLQHNESSWSERYHHVTHSKKLVANTSKVKVDELKDNDLWELAHAHREFGSKKAATALFQRFQQRQPDNIAANFYLGEGLAEHQQLSALKYLKVAFKRYDTVADAARYGYDMLKQMGRDAEAEKWWQEAVQEVDKQTAIHEARSSVTLDDHFAAGRMEPAMLEQLCEQLRAHKNVGSAWLAQKTLPYRDAEPLYVLAYRPKGLFTSFSKVTRSISESIQIDGEICVLCLWDDERKLAGKVKKTGTKII